MPTVALAKVAVMPSAIKQRLQRVAAHHSGKRSVAVARLPTRGARDVETKCEAGTLVRVVLADDHGPRLLKGAKGQGCVVSTVERRCEGQPAFTPQPAAARLASLRPSACYCPRNSRFTVVAQRPCCQVSAAYPHRAALRCNATSRVMALPLPIFHASRSWQDLPPLRPFTNQATAPAHPPSAHLSVFQLDYRPVHVTCKRCDMSLFIVMLRPIVHVLL